MLEPSISRACLLRTDGALKKARLEVNGRTQKGLIMEKPASGFFARCAICKEVIPEEEAVEQNQQSPAGYSLGCNQYVQEAQALNVQLIQQFWKSYREEQPSE
jgi:hypothetical protein